MTSTRPVVWQPAVPPSKPGLTTSPRRRVVSVSTGATAPSRLRKRVKRTLAGPVPVSSVRNAKVT